MSDIRVQELNTRGAFARDMLFINEYPKLDDGFGEEAQEHMLLNLTEVFNTPDDVIRFMSRIPEEGPGTGKRLQTRLHCFLPKRGADLIVILDPQQEGIQAALAFPDGEIKPVDDEAAEELPQIERLRIVNLILEGVLNSDDPGAAQGLMEEVINSDPEYPLLPEMIVGVSNFRQDPEWGVGKLRELETNQEEKISPILQSFISQSLQVAQEELKASPQDLGLKNRVGFLLLQQENFEEAMKHFREILSADSKNERSYANLAICLMQVGQLEEALSTLDTAKKELGEDSPMVAWLSNIMAQQILAETPPHEAEPILRKHCVITPDLFHALAAAYADLEASAAAEERLEELLKNFPEDARAHYNLGVLSEEPEELVRRCQLALKFDPAYDPARQALPKAISVRDKRNQDLVAENVEADLTYINSQGKPLTLIGVPIAAEFVFSYLMEQSDGPLDLGDDKHLLQLLAAKGHNRLFEIGEKDKYIEMVVYEVPSQEFLLMAGSLAWETPEGETILSAPVAVILLDPEKQERTPLVAPHGHILRLERTLAVENEAGDNLAWPYPKTPSASGSAATRFGFSKNPTLH